MTGDREIVLMMFSKKDAATAVAATGRTVVGGKIVDSDGQPARCRKCETPVTVENLGRILPGSIDLYCDDPTCFNDFSVKLV